MEHNEDVTMSTSSPFPESPQLLLRVDSYRNASPPAPLQAAFTAAGGLVGRAPGNDLVLPDPGKYISRSHASLSWRDDRFYWRDTGSNPTLVNGRPLGAGTEAALNGGERIEIGDYVLTAALELPVNADDTMLMTRPPLPLFTPPPPPVAAPLPPFEAWQPPPAPPAPDVGAAFDRLASASILADAIGPHPVPLGPDALADPLGLNLSGGGAPAVTRAAQPDHVAPELHAFTPPAPFSAIPADYDPLADRQAPAPEVPPPVAVAPAPVPASSTAGDGAVLQALLDGLGLPQLRSSHPPEQLARLAGEMLRAATAGTMEILLARALTKRESHIDMTMIAPRANNPLKFFPDAESALTQMLGAQMAGYLAPPAAIAGAFDDLKAHEMAVIAGMHAALAAVVQRFDPARIVQRLPEPGKLDRLLPSNRKAHLWDRLVELYGELARDADEDLQRLFGEKFSGAYAEQVARLRGHQLNPVRPYGVE